MKTIYAREFNITPDSSCARELEMLLASLKESDEEKSLIFERGEYILESRDLSEHRLVITNTAGDGEYSSDERPHIAKVGLYFGEIRNLTVEGNGAKFILDGLMTNIAVENCENITLKNFELIPKNPDMHELTVTSLGEDFAEFEIDSESEFELCGGEIWLTGTDYRRKIDERAEKVGYIPLVRAKTPNKTERVHHPFRGMKSLVIGSGRRFTAKFKDTSRFEIGDKFYIYHDRRSYVGIFANESKNTSLFNIKQRFNYSLAFVAQCCDGITLEGLEFAPLERKIASLADFLQICMCKGKINIENCVFEGAGDDCMNVHGVHFRITKAKGREITVKFMHPQTHGFNPLKIGDEIALIDFKTLLEKDRAKILACKMLNEYEIALTLDREIKPKRNDCIEDITMCPEVVFKNNTVSRIITRGLLITNRKRVEITGNRFISCSASGILLSDDTNAWFESGISEEVIIQNNIFEFCGEAPILIKPEIRKFAGAVHKNITVRENTFLRYPAPCVVALAADGLQILGNSFSDGEKLSAENCTNLQTDF